MLFKILYLKVWTGHAFGDLPEQLLLDLDELRRIDDVEDLLDLAEEHDLLLRARFRPELEQAAHDRLGEHSVLLEELHDAVGQLRVVQRQTLDFVQRQQHLDQKLFVLDLERQGESVDYAVRGELVVRNVFLLLYD